LNNGERWRKRSERTRESKRRREKRNGNQIGEEKYEVEE
jgi:hypothetical protein